LIDHFLIILHRHFNCSFHLFDRLLFFNLLFELPLLLSKSKNPSRIVQQEILCCHEIKVRHLNRIDDSISIITHKAHHSFDFLFSRIPCWSCKLTFLSPILIAVSLLRILNIVTNIILLQHLARWEISCYFFQK
jgi:hypothetical protein